MASEGALRLAVARDEPVHRYDNRHGRFHISCPYSGELAHCSAFAGAGRTDHAEHRPAAGDRSEPRRAGSAVRVRSGEFDKEAVEEVLDYERLRGDAKEVEWEPIELLGEHASILGESNRGDLHGARCGGSELKRDIGEDPDPAVKPA